MPAPPPPRTPPPPPQAPRPRNPRTAGKAPHGVLEVDWPFFGEMCRALALKIFREYDPDVVIGIARAGVIPGAVVASILQRDFASMAITRTETGGRPVGLARPQRLLDGPRVGLGGEHLGTGGPTKASPHPLRRVQAARAPNPR